MDGAKSEAQSMAQLLEKLLGISTGRPLPATEGVLSEERAETYNTVLLQPTTRWRLRRRTWGAAS